MPRQHRDLSFAQSKTSLNSSILHDVSFKDAPVLAPTLVIKFPLCVETFGSGISHIQSVMCVVVGKETLSAKSQQTVYLTQPLIQLIEAGLIASLVDGICLAEASDNNLQHTSRRRKPRRCPRCSATSSR